jgi:hypothetical protein
LSSFILEENFNLPELCSSCDFFSKFTKSQETLQLASYCLLLTPHYSLLTSQCIGTRVCNKGIEIDCIIENGDRLTPIEIKSGNTFNPHFFKNLNYWNNLSGNKIENAYVIYGGDSSKDTKEGKLLSWREVGGLV